MFSDFGTEREVEFLVQSEDFSIEKLHDWLINSNLRDAVRVLNIIKARRHGDYTNILLELLETYPKLQEFKDYMDNTKLKDWVYPVGPAMG